jgi:hypothetical protein
VVPLAALQDDPAGWAAALADAAALPHARATRLVPTRPDAVPGLSAELQQRAAGLALIELANSWRQNTLEDCAVLTFQGAQSRQFTVPSSGWPHEPLDVLGMRDWAGESTERLLAVQHALAGYSQSDLGAAGAFKRALATAETVLRVMQADAVGTAYQAVREARRAAVDAAKASSDAALAAARSVAERVLAGLAATGAVVVAQAATKLPADVARHLAVAVACYLGLLCAWSLLVEGPAVTAPLRAFRDDLPVTADLLGDQQRDEVLGLRALRLAWWRARTIRIVGPAIYGAAGAAVLGLSVHTWSQALHLTLLIPK